MVKQEYKAKLLQEVDVGQSVDTFMKSETWQKIVALVQRRRYELAEDIGKNYHDDEELKYLEAELFGLRYLHEFLESIVEQGKKAVDELERIEKMEKEE